MNKLVRVLWVAFLLLVGYSGSMTTEGPTLAQGVRPLTAEDLFKEVSRSVFVVRALDASGRPVEQGSAVVIRDGILETNYHVVRDGVRFVVLQGLKKWPARLIATNPHTDLAELTIEKLGAPAVSIRQSSSLAVGERVYAIGAPEGLELTLSEGLISSIRQSADGRVIQTTAAISPGSSGGGLFDTSGRLVGITSAFLKEGESLNFALPAELISSVRTAAEWVEAGSRAYHAADNGFKTSKSEAEELCQEAADDYEQAVHLSPNDEGAWVGLGNARRLDLGKEEQAKSAYKTALRLRPDDERAWAGLGIVESGRDSIAAFRNAVRLDPKDVDAWEGLGARYMGLSQFQDALMALDTAKVLINPNDERAWARLGLWYLGDAQFQGQLSDLAKEYGVDDPNDKFISVFLTQALECLQRAVKLNPDDASAWDLTGEAYAQMADRAGVTRVYEKLKVLDPKKADEFFNKFVVPQ